MSQIASKSKANSKFLIFVIFNSLLLYVVKLITCADEGQFVMIDYMCGAVVKMSCHLSFCVGSILTKDDFVLSLDENWARYLYVKNK